MYAIRSYYELGEAADIELLHQFRVAIRRTRSLLKLYLSAHYALHESLKSIVQRTNVLRELDVFVASLDAVLYPDLARLV